MRASQRKQAYSAACVALCTTNMFNNYHRLRSFAKLRNCDIAQVKIEQTVLEVL